MSDLQTLQAALSVPATGSWDPATAAAAVKFQAAHGLMQTGAPDPATFAAAGIYDPSIGAPPAGTSVVRDLVAAENQVPGWLYIGLGGASLLLAYLAYRSSNR